MKTQITLSQAIDGYFLDAHARHLSPRTILDYQNGFRHFQRFIGNPIFTSITQNDIRRFLANLGSHPVIPGGIANRSAIFLSKKTILNIHIALSALWTWAISEGIITNHVVRAVRPPRPEQPVIVPFSREDIEAMLVACGRSNLYTRPDERECSYTRPTATRDRAIILLLLDTGIRAGELAADPRHQSHGLAIQDLNQRNLQIKVLGKGDKERIIPISHSTLKSLWRYLLAYPDANPADPLFRSITGRPVTVNGLRQLIKRLGQRADVANAHPHRFRHTFAITFLRNGGKTFELQHLLGHSTLEMVKRYVAIAQVDLENAHRRASPVANWNL